MQGLSLGAIDYIPKPFLFHELSSKIDSIVKKHQKQREAFLQSFRSYLNDPEIQPNKANEHNSSFEENCAKYNFTNREIEIIKLIAKGQTYKVIGEALFISDKTVAKHMENVLKKAGIGSRTELINKLFNTN